VSGFVRNRDSWRIAEHCETYVHQTLVSNGWTMDLWPNRDVQHIEPRRLDTALMELRDYDPDAYERFLATMTHQSGESDA
jgi:hypothetical protein